MNLLRGLTRLRVKEVRLPCSTDPALGTGIDITKLPEGHLCCTHCGKPFFECWVDLPNHRITMGCIHCGSSYKLLAPLDVDLKALGQGRFSCHRHPKSGLVLIHNVDVICIGCQYCDTEADIKLRKSSGLILA